MDATADTAIGESIEQLDVCLQSDRSEICLFAFPFQPRGAMAKPLFHQAVQPLPSSWPASGSQNDHVLYGGSRRGKLRFEYSENSRSAFIDLHWDFMLTPEQFKAFLEEVQGVTEVQWHTTKTSQGNVGNVGQALPAKPSSASSHAICISRTKRQRKQ